MSKYIKLTNACDITTGKLDSNAYDDKGLYPFFTCAPEPLRINTPAFNADAILLAGNNAAGNFHLNRYNGEFNAYQRTYVITAKKGYSLDYIYYTLKKVVVELKNKAQGSQTKFITMQMLNDINIEDIHYLEQIKKVKLMSSIDQKIELNTKINQELETLAKTIYDYWFLQFEFPNEEGKPYKSSGGKMVFSKELGREIPEGWEVLYLKDRLEFERGVEPGSSNYVDNKGENLIKFIRVSDMGGSVGIYVNKDIVNDKILKPEDVVVSFDGSVGRIGFGLNGAYSTGMQKIYDKTGQLNNAFIYYLFSSNEIQQTILKYATGSIILHASKSIEFLKLVYSEEVINKFKEIVTPIFDKQIKFKQENEELEELRDWLLPMLMNGQVVVE